jgi:hypothetical protein
VAEHITGLTRSLAECPFKYVTYFPKSCIWQFLEGVFPYVVSSLIDEQVVLRCVVFGVVLLKPRSLTLVLS